MSPTRVQVVQQLHELCLPFADCSRVLGSGQLHSEAAMLDMSWPHQHQHLPAKPPHIRTWQRLHGLAWIALILTACADDPSGPSVDPRLVASLKIVDAPTALLVADTFRLKVVARDSAGAAITPTVTWATGNASVASVSRTGL